MNVRELQAALRVLETAYAAGGAAKQAREIGELVQSLEEHAGRSVEELAAIAAAQLKPKASAQVRGEFSQTVVDRYVAELSEAGTSISVFNKVFSDLKSDKSAKILEVVEIANRFQNAPTNGSFRFKFDTRASALEFILSTFMGRAESESRLNSTDRTTKWA